MGSAAQSGLGILRPKNLQSAKIAVSKLPSHSSIETIETIHYRVAMYFFMPLPIPASIILLPSLWFGPAFSRNMARDQGLI